MEDSMEKVAKHCGRELATYQNCLLSNPQDPTQCDPQKASLSECATSAIPLLSSIKSQCTPQIQAFDLCLRENQSKQVTDAEMEKNCGDALRELWRCTEVVKRRQGVTDDGLRSGEAFTSSR